MRTGGSTEERRRAVNERRSEMMKYLRQSNGPVRFTSLGEMFDISDWTARMDCKQLYADNPDELSIQTGIVIYLGNGSRKQDRYPMHKTEEGYSDPTAATVIRKLDPAPTKGVNTMMPKGGDVWNVSYQNKEDKFLVLGVDTDGGYATCMPYIPKGEKCIDIEYMSKRLCTKPLKYFSERVWGTPLSQMSEIKMAISSYLGIEPVEVVKEVEVIKEVPVEVPQKVTDISSKRGGKMFTQEEMDLALMRQKAEIYEKCFSMITMGGVE